MNVLSAWTKELNLYNISYINFFSQKKFTLAQREEIEKQKRKLEEEKEEFKRQTEAVMTKKIQEKEQQRLAMEAAKMHQTEEERREVFSRIQELEAKMKEMKTKQTPGVRNVMNINK